MCKRHLARPRHAAAADQRSSACACDAARGKDAHASARRETVRRATQLPPIPALHRRSCPAATREAAGPASICRCPAGRSGAANVRPRRQSPPRACPVPARERRSTRGRVRRPVAGAAQRAPAGPTRRSGARTPQGATGRAAPGHPARARLRLRTPRGARKPAHRDAPRAPSRAHRGSRATRRSARARPRIRGAQVRSGGTWPFAARMPMAIGRSKRPDSFGRSAGARLTVTLRAGNSNRAFCSAARTRSRASRTSVSASPTMCTPGRPPARCTSTVTLGASTPDRPRL